MYYVYILKSDDHNRIYIGSSENIMQRLSEHNQGKVKSTKSYVPWEIVYYEAHQNKALALKAESFYKSSQGRRQVKKKLDFD